MFIESFMKLRTYDRDEKAFLILDFTVKIRNLHIKTSGVPELRFLLGLSLKPQKPGLFILLMDTFPYCAVTALLYNLQLQVGLLIQIQPEFHKYNICVHRKDAVQRKKKYIYIQRLQHHQKITQRYFKIKNHTIQLSQTHCVLAGLAVLNVRILTA